MNQSISVNFSKCLTMLLAVVSASLQLAHCQTAKAALPLVYYSDASRVGHPFLKDPSVIRFHDRYFMYFSLPPVPSGPSAASGEPMGWTIGIATSQDLIHWAPAGNLFPTQEVERQGIAAPGARVIDGKVHLFYQTYGLGPKDAICHAVSTDGIHFDHDVSNPVYRPTHMPWSNGRAIDAEVLLVPSIKKAYLYFATRDPSSKRQMLGMAEAALDSGFGAGTWHDVSTAGPILEPTLPWEQDCIEAPSVMERNGVFYLFYGGAYNNAPQQIGLARSADGIHWKRVGTTPFVPNGPVGSWNSSESGHPGVFQDSTLSYLFYQGNNDHGRSYGVSMAPLTWDGDIPRIDAMQVRPEGR